MTKEEKYSLARWVMNHALSKGANQVSVSISDSKSSEIEVRERKIDTLKEAIQCSLVIRLFVDKKYSSHSTNRLNKTELMRFVEEAIEATRFLAEDEFRSLPEPEMYYKGGGVELNVYDKNYESIDAKTKIDLAFKLEEEIYKTDERIISISAGYSDGCDGQILLTSNGFEGDTLSSYYSLGASVTVDGKGARPDYSKYESAIFFEELEKSGMAKEALKRALGKIGQTKIGSGKYTMLVENRSIGRILGPIMNAMNGASIQQKNSFYIDKLDQKVASDKFTVVDDPFIVGGYGSMLFDSEGLALKKRNLFDKGVLKTYLINTYYGKKLGVSPNSGQTSNIVFDAGDRSLEEMTKSLDNGIFVTGFNGGNCNSSTGDFSYGIEGFLIEKGQLTKPISEMNITGNMKQLWLDLIELGNDAKLDSPWRTPSMMFANVDFSGM